MTGDSADEEQGRHLADQFRGSQESRDRLEEMSRKADSNLGGTPWTNLAPSALLLDWLTENFDPPTLLRALVVSCGSGDDAEELADWGFGVTAIDPSKAVVYWCRDRFVGSAVTYKTADLLNPPNTFAGAFDFVYEALTLRTLEGSSRLHAIRNLASFLAPKGLLLVICPARDSEDTVSRGVSKEELNALEKNLAPIQFEDFLDHEEPPVRRFRAVYRKA